MGCGPWGRKELDRTEHLMLSLSTFKLFMRLVGVCGGSLLDTCKRMGSHHRTLQL